MPKRIDRAPAYVEREEIVAYKKFTLTTPEKRFIRAYVKYKDTIVSTVAITEILIVFDWDDPFRDRYYPAYRDWAMGDQRFCGCFKMVVNAIEEYIAKCRTGK